MLRNAVGEVPHDRPRLRVAERMHAVVLHRHPDQPARDVGLPVLALGRLLLVVGELVPPAQLLDEHMIDFGIPGREVAALRIRAIRREQRHAVALDAEVGAEAAAAVHHVLRRVVQVGRPGMLQFRRAVARPRQSVIVAVARTAARAQRLHVERRLVLHVQLEPLRRLPGVADRERALVDFLQDRLGRRLVPAVLVLHHLVVLGELLVEAELLGERDHQRVVGLRFEQRLDHLLAPLQRTVRRRDGAGSLELSRRGQQVHAVLAHHRAHRGGRRRIRIDDDHEVELLHRLDHVLAARLAVGRMAPVHHRLHVRTLVDHVVRIHDARRSTATPWCPASPSCLRRTAS